MKRTALIFLASIFYLLASTTRISAADLSLVVSPPRVDLEGKPATRSRLLKSPIIALTSHSSSKL